MGEKRCRKQEQMLGLDSGRIISPQSITLEKAIFSIGNRVML